MNKYQLSIDDINKKYLHFIKKKNLVSIKEKVLLPKIGFHAQALETTKKVFSCRRAR